MKRSFLLFFALLLVSCIIIACGEPENEPAGTEGSVISASAEETVAETPSFETASSESEAETGTEQPEKTAFTFDPDDYTFVRKFPAPEGDKREIVMDYMLAMSNVEWTPAEDFTIKWKDKETFSVNLDFEKGKTYTGMPYARTGCSLEFFEQFLKDGVFKDRSYYYEEVVGNNCSQSMFLAYQQIIDLPITGGFKPISAREGQLMFPLDENGNEILQKPDFNTFGDKWITKDLFAANSVDSVYKAYSMLGKSDFLYRNIEGAGHTRLVDRVEIKTTYSGKVNYAQSAVVCVEQTNLFDKQRPGVNSTWYINHRYTFTQLIDAFFMPVTLCAFHNETPLEDAYILFKSTDGPENILEGSDGVVRSNFPLNYIKLTLTDTDGKIVSVATDCHFDMTYTYQINKLHYDLFKDVPSGTYTFTVRAGIARGGCDVESFQVTVP